MEFKPNDETKLTQEDIRKQDELINEAAKIKVESPELDEKRKKELKEAIDINEALYRDMSAFTVESGIEIDTGEYLALPTGVKVLDAILGGGFCQGALSQIIGKPGTFKSALLAQVIGYNQQLFIKRFFPMYFDSETTMSKERLMSLGITNPPIEPNTKVSVETIFKAIQAISNYVQQSDIENLVNIIGWDSIANTATDAEMKAEHDDINKTTGLRARMLSSLFPRYLNRMRKNNISVIAINQLRDKISMGGFGEDKTSDIRFLGDNVIPGGKAIIFNSHHILHMKTVGNKNLDPEVYGFQGCKLKATCYKNKFCPPNITVELFVDYTSGISDFWTSYNFLTEHKAIKASAWNKFTDHADYGNWRTKDAKSRYDDPNDDFKQIFDKVVDETIKRELIDVHGIKMRSPFVSS